MFDRQKDKQQDSKSETQTATAAPKPETRGSASDSKPAGGSGKMATIGATVHIKGDISGDENLLVEGRVEGTISLASHELMIGQSGKVNADLSAKVVRVDGEVQGDITGKERVFVSSTSNIKGNIITPKMTLEEGARFKGSIDIDPNAGGASGGQSGVGQSTSPSASAGSGKSSSSSREEPQSEKDSSGTATAGKH